MKSCNCCSRITAPGMLSVPGRTAMILDWGGTNSAFQWKGAVVRLNGPLVCAGSRTQPPTIGRFVMIDDGSAVERPDERAFFGTDVGSPPWR
jgi:hypothetical protein